DGAPGDGSPDAGANCFAQWRDGPLKLSTPQKLSALANAGDDRDPSISGHGLTLYFTSNRNGRQEIFRATRMTTHEPFDTADRLENLIVSQKDQERAALTADERTLVLASNRGASGRF